MGGDGTSARVERFGSVHLAPTPGLSLFNALSGPGAGHAPGDLRICGSSGVGRDGIDTLDELTTLTEWTVTQ